jgi:hypothetical protein
MDFNDLLNFALQLMFLLHFYLGLLSDLALKQRDGCGAISTFDT